MVLGAQLLNWQPFYTFDRLMTGSTVERLPFLLLLWAATVFAENLPRCRIFSICYRGTTLGTCVTQTDIKRIVFVAACSRVGCIKSYYTFWIQKDIPKLYWLLNVLLTTRLFWCVKKYSFLCELFCHLHWEDEIQDNAEIIVSLHPLQGKSHSC